MKFHQMKAAKTGKNESTSKSFHLAFVDCSLVVCHFDHVVFVLLSFISIFFVSICFFNSSIFHSLYFNWKFLSCENWKYGKRKAYNEKTQTFSIEKYIWNNSLTYFFPLLDTLDSLKWEKKLANDSLRWSIQESILGIRMNSCHMTEYNGRQ